VVVIAATGNGANPPRRLEQRQIIRRILDHMLGRNR
jgi:hypothetical protein